MTCVRRRGTLPLFPVPLNFVPHGPHRLEPRAVKRRAKEYDRLNRPRDRMRKAQLRKALVRK
jgi:hypothetical protein